MRHSACIIYVARVGVVDIKAVIEFVDLYYKFYVWLDIDWDRYKDLFYKYRNNVVVTPHTAGVSKQAIGRMDIEIANKIITLCS